MARFMIVTFLLLGWGFFELSGGTDFEPPQAEAKPLNELLEQVAEDERNLVARADQSPASAEIIGQAQVTEDRQPVTLASFETLTAGPSLATVLGEAATVVAPAPAPVAVAAAPVDLRVVTGSRVNMRNGPGTGFQVLTQLLAGDEAEVLQAPGNGWVKIRVSDTGRVGWMAERLMAPVN